MILLHLSLLLSLPPPYFPRALTSGKTLRCVGGSAEIWSTTLVNRAKNVCVCARGRIVLRCRMRWEATRFTSWRPMAVWPLASTPHVLFIIYAAGSLFPPADSPAKENGEWRSLHEADLTRAPLPRLQAVTPLCCWTFLPLKPNFCPPKEGKYLQEQSNLLEEVVLSASSLSLILYCVSSIWQVLLFWKTADIESAVSDCTANSRQVLWLLM